MQIFVKTSAGEKYTLDVEPDETILDVKRKLSTQQDFTPQQMKFIYSGKQLRDYVVNSRIRRTLKDYAILDCSTLHVLRTTESVASYTDFVELPSAESAREAKRVWQSKADMYDFDLDLHIVEPESHYILLRQLERHVLRRSEYYRQRKAAQAVEATVLSCDISSKLLAEEDMNEALELSEGWPRSSEVKVGL